MEEYIEFIKKVIDVPEEEMEPFCPLCGMYCSCAYTESRCTTCEDGQREYEKRVKEGW